VSFLEQIVEYTKKRVEMEYRNYRPTYVDPNKRNLIDAIKKCKNVPVIAEVKPASPSQGNIRLIDEPDKIALELVAGGAVGVSVLTEPKYFHGSVENLIKIREAVESPILMKDFIIDERQIFHAAEIGADAVLLISSICHRLEAFYDLTESLRMNALVEVHDEADIEKISSLNPKLIGINNRDLTTLKTDLKQTARLTPILREKFPTSLIVSESGIKSAEDVRYVVGLGADAVLVGTSVMQSSNVKAKVKELVEAMRSG
jgi:indole-3-glycerol phosphate synthase